MLADKYAILADKCNSSFLFRTGSDYTIHTIEANTVGSKPSYDHEGERVIIRVGEWLNCHSWLNYKISIICKAMMISLT